MIILLGAPGSGKGTQSRLLAQRDGFKVFALGEILRSEIANSTHYGKTIEASIKKGEFAPLEIVISLLKQHVMHKDFVLDGFPRNMSQVFEFEKFIHENSSIDFDKSVKVIDFIVPCEILCDRLKNRRLCKVCDGALLCEAKECNFCGHYSEDAYMRDDDCNCESVARRLEIFHQEKDLLIEHYSKKGIYHAVDATQQVEEVYAEVKSIIA